MNIKLARGILLVLGGGWFFHGTRVWLVGNTRAAGVFFLWSLLFLAGAPLVRRCKPWQRSHLSAALFCSGVACMIAFNQGATLPIWGLVGLPALLLLWSGWRLAVGWGLVILSLICAEVFFSAPASVNAGLVVLFQRLTMFAALGGLSLFVLQALDGVNQRIQDREAALQRQTEELEKELATLQQARDQALEEGQLKSNFLATMSHELRTPLNAVLGMANLLQETSLTEEQQEYTTTIVGGSQALLTLIGDILDVSKLEAGKLEVEQVSVDLPSVAEQALALVSAQAHLKGLELYFEPSPLALPVAVTDPARLQQILVNLLSNAVKFTDHGEVVLELLPGKTPEEAVFSVKDSGIGIAREMQQKLFRPFSQVGHSGSRGGTGLGLAISHSLVGLLGGTISVESELGRGSTFSFSVRSRGEPRLSSSLGLVTEIPGNVLVLDAHERSGELLRNMLSGLARKVDVHRTAAEFFVALGASDKVDVLIVDPRVSFESSTEFLEQLANVEGKLPPVVVLYPKGAPDRNLIEAFFQAHFRRQGSALLPKPVVQRQLLPALLAACLGEPTPERSTTGRALQREHKPRMRVLVAEDNPVNQRVVAKMLEKLGHEALLVENGQLALETLRREEIDVVLMDVQMPVMDGLEATRRITKEIPRHKRPRIIGLTANALAGDRESCLAAGMDDYLSKPVQVQDLARVFGASAREPAELPRTSSDVIDPHVASQLRLRHSPPQLSELIEQFSGQLVTNTNQIIKAFSVRNFSQIEVVAGQLRELCASFGLARLYAVLVKIEADAKVENVAELTRYIGRLERENDSARKALLRLSSSFSGTFLPEQLTNNPALAAGIAARNARPRS